MSGERRRARPASAGAGVLGLAAVVALAGGCGGSGEPEGHDSGLTGIGGHQLTCPSPRSSGPVSWPAQLPAGFPRPPAAQAVAGSNPSAGLQEVQFDVPTSMRDNVAFLLDALPKAGYVIGRTDSEADEADLLFSHAGTNGQIRLSARGSCLTHWTVVTLAPHTSPTGPLLPSHSD